MIPPEEPDRRIVAEAFAVTYRRPAVLERTLRLVLAQTRPPSRILIVDNDPAGSAEPVARRLSADGFLVEHRGLGDNQGPAGAAAAALRDLSARGVGWALWIDDDDPPESPDDLERLLAIAETEPGPVGVVGAIGQRWSWRTGRMLRVPDRDLTGPIDVDSVAGGCLPLINVKAAEQAGYPDARLFFGLEELDFCLRVRRAGYRIVADGGLMRARREARGRLGWKRPVLPRAAAWAAPWRQYYSTRNYVFFMRETFARPDLARLWAARAVAKALLAVARHPREGRALSAALLRGVRDGHASRMGRTVEPVAKGSGDG